MFDTRFFYQQCAGDRRDRREWRPMPQRVTRLNADRPSPRQQIGRR
jgi:hypothetical protein